MQPDASTQPPSTDSAGSDVELEREESGVERSVSTDIPQTQPHPQPESQLQLQSESKPQSGPQRILVEQPPDVGPSVVPVQDDEEGNEDDDADAVGEPDQEMSVDDIVNVNGTQPDDDDSLPRQQLVADDGTPVGARRARIAAVLNAAGGDPRDMGKKHHKGQKRQKQRSGKGYE